MVYRYDPYAMKAAPQIIERYYPTAVNGSYATTDTGTVTTTNGNGITVTHILIIAIIASLALGIGLACLIKKDKN